MIQTQRKNHSELEKISIISLVICSLTVAKPIHGEDLAAIADRNGVAQTLAKPALVSPTETKPYRIKSGDKLAFALLNTGYEEDANPTVDNQGIVNLPLLGMVKVSGKTLEETLYTLQMLYGHEYFVNPRLKLTVVEKAKIQYKILGQVANPGFYEVPPNLNINLLDAIAIAGGYTRLAGKITLRKPERTGPDKITSFRVKKLAKANSTSIPSISGGESIVVGETFF
jgi:protein involved in polysaccharide export with SLBB domain